MSRSLGVNGHPAEQGGTGVNDYQLAVLLRQTQWALDEAAHDVAAGQATPQRRGELAWSLEALAAIVRATAPDRTTTQAPGNANGTGHLSAH